MSDGDKVNRRVNILTHRNITMIQAERKFHKMLLPKLLLLLLLIFMSTPSSARAVRLGNYSMAQARHARHVHRDHGNPGGIIPVQPTSAATSANIVGSVEEPSSTPTFSPFTIPSSTPAVQSISTSALVIPEPPIRTSVKPTSVAVIISVSDMTVTPLTTSDVVIPTPTLAPITAPLGTIVSMPPNSIPANPTATIPSSNFGALEHSSSTSTPSKTVTSAPSSALSATPSPTPPTASQEHLLIVWEAIIITLGSIALMCLVFWTYRRRSRRARARAPRREIELVEVVAPSQAEAVRDEILKRRAGVERNSLEEIMAATERSAAREGTQAPAGELAATARDAGQGSRKGADDEWETLPPYAR